MSNPNDASGYSKSDLISQGFIHLSRLMAWLDDTRAVSHIELARFDAIVVARGQAPLVTMQRQTALHQNFVGFYLAGRVAAALCHGSTNLRYAALPSGKLLAHGKSVTGFANVEENCSDNVV